MCIFPNFAKNNINMKFGKIILLSLAIILLDHCKKEPDEPYTVDRILIDNAMAVSYFHILFRDAENAWAYIDSMKYELGTYHISPGKIMNCHNDKNKNKDKTEEQGKDTISVIIDYKQWNDHAGHILNGTISIDFKKEKTGYREVNGAIADIALDNLNFSINGQRVTGGSRLTYQKVANSETDRYNFTLLSGSAIYEEGQSKPILISATINGGRYVRTAGGDPFKPEDDEWSYIGTMTGSLGKDQKIKYNNSVMTSYLDGNGKTQDGTVYFSTECSIAKQGTAQIKIAGQPDIIYWYECSGIYYQTVTHVQ